MKPKGERDKREEVQGAAPGGRGDRGRFAKKLREGQGG